jgi:hypothetical protein
MGDTPCPLRAPTVQPRLEVAGWAQNSQEWERIIDLCNQTLRLRVSFIETRHELVLPETKY